MREVHCLKIYAIGAVIKVYFSLVEIRNIFLACMRVQSSKTKKNIFSFFVSDFTYERLQFFQLNRL